MSSTNAPTLPTPIPFPSPLPPLLVGVSTKMYFTHARTISYLQSLLSSFPHEAAPSSPAPSHPHHRLSIFYIPSFPSLLPCAQLLRSSTLYPSPPALLLGAQDCAATPTLAAATGSVSPLQLSELGVCLVELGHAERRAPPHNETDELTVKKAVAAVKTGLVPLVCVGERNMPRQGMLSEGVGRALEEVWSQISWVLDGLEEAGRKGEGVEGSLAAEGRTVRTDVVFAYEPVWAIGASEPASSDHVCAVVGEVKRRVQARWGLGSVVGESGEVEGERKGGEVRILYGGSAGPGTWDGLKGVCDGLFLGRFAHNVRNVEVVVKEMLA